MNSCGNLPCNHLGELQPWMIRGWTAQCILADYLKKHKCLLMWDCCYAESQKVQQICLESKVHILGGVKGVLAKLAPCLKVAACTTVIKQLITPHNLLCEQESETRCCHTHAVAKQCTLLLWPCTAACPCDCLQQDIVMLGPAPVQMYMLSSSAYKLVSSRGKLTSCLWCSCSSDHSPSTTTPRSLGEH